MNRRTDGIAGPSPDRRPWHRARYFSSDRKTSVSKQLMFDWIP